MGAIESIESSEIRTEAIDFSFGELLNLHRDGEIVIRPEYQRLFRWTTEQRSRLIESILLRLPIPPIFLVEDDDGVLELIDGLQRTSSVLQFLDHSAIGENELVLKGCDIVEELNGMKFSDFTTSIRLQLKRTPIRAIIIKRSGDDYVKYEMFKRLNTGGELLSAQEIRNCSSRMISGGAEFYALLQSLSDHPSFKAASIRIPEPDQEKRADEELVLRFFAVIGYRDRFRGNVKDWIDNFMEDQLFGRLPEVIQPDLFKRFFDFVNLKFGDGAFSRYRSGSPSGRLAPAYFEAVVGALYQRFDELAGRDPDQMKRLLAETFESDRFKAATGPGANSKEKMQERIDVIYEAFF